MGNDWLEEDLARCFVPLLAFCLTVDCECVQTAEVAPPSKLNAKLVQNGKPPLDSYHVLILPTPATPFVKDLEFTGAGVTCGG